MPFVLTTPIMYCEDRPNRPHYNASVKDDPTTLATCETEGKCPERLKREDGLYRRLIWVEHNTPAIADAGSCIFLHVRREGTPTVGCAAFNAADLEALLAWLDPIRRPALLELPYEEYAARREAWVLPKLP